MNRVAHRSHSSCAWRPAAALLSLGLGACSAESPPGNHVPPPGSGPADAGTMSMNPPGSDAGLPVNPVCDEQALALELEAVKVLFLVDSSSSMRDNDRWTQASEAIRTIVEDPANADTRFGLHAFPDPGLLGCGVDDPPAVEVAESTGTSIVQWMTDNSPGILRNTPLVDAIEYYVRHPSAAIHDGETANYLVVISDGEDNCYSGEGNFSDTDKLNILGGLVHELGRTSGIKTIAIGFGDSAPEGTLNTIARNGGSSFTSFIAAADGAELTAALQEIAQAIRPCTYRLQSPDALADPSKVNFYFDSRLVPRDRTRTDGWNWTKNSELEVEFYGAACNDIKSGDVANVRATFGCPTSIGADGRVCASRDSFLSMPDVGVLLLQDFSGSMTEADKWRDATIAITRMVTDERNRHVEFGLDVFPDDQGGANACGAEPFPNVPVGDYNTLAIVDWISNHDPSGSTPLSAALERVAFNPGRIGENRVSGAVVVVSDGGDSCSQASDVAAELGQRTRDLVSRHNLQVFAVGFGSAVEPAQLDNIAAEGGTGLQSYIQASNLTELEDVFARISSLVTSCVLEVPYAGPDVNYTTVNYFFDGTVVPRDSRHQDGWDWVNAVTMTQVEFFGAACEALRSGSIRDVVVEFGCETELNL